MKVRERERERLNYNLFKSERERKKDLRKIKKWARKIKRIIKKIKKETENNQRTVKESRENKKENNLRKNRERKKEIHRYIQYILTDCFCAGNVYLFVLTAHDLNSGSHRCNRQVTFIPRQPLKNCQKRNKQVNFWCTKRHLWFSLQQSQM